MCIGLIYCYFKLVRDLLFLGAYAKIGNDTQREIKKMMQIWKH